MNDSDNGEAKKKKRPRIQRVQSHIAPSYSFKGQMYASPKARQELYAQFADDEVTFVNKLKDFENVAYIRKNKSRCRKFLNDIVSDADKKLLNEDVSDCFVLKDLVRKYHKCICWAATKEQAKEDCKIYCSGNVPEDFKTRPDDIRLETMEELKRALDDKKINKDTYNHIKDKYFSDVISKDALANSTEIGMMRIQAAGHDFKDEGGYSQAFRNAMKHKSKNKYKPEDFDLFGYDGRGDPLCPAWYAVASSNNFQNTLLKVQKVLADMGVEPREAYKFNHKDYNCIIKKAGGLAQVNDAPYQEFCKKFGKMLLIGSGKLNESKKRKYWEIYFATDAEKSMEDDAKDEAYRDFEKICRRNTSKIKNDFAENNMSSGFFEAWVDNLAKTGSYKAKSVDWNEKDDNIPFKIDIHHNHRLASGGTNDLSNLTLIVMFHAYDFDVHASKHRGESQNFVLKNALQRQNENIDKGFVYQSSGNVSVRDICFGECCDKCEVAPPKVNTAILEKSAELKKRIKTDTAKTPTTCVARFKTSEGLGM